MAKIDLHARLRGVWTDDTRPKALFERHVAAAPKTYVGDIVRGLASTERRVQNGCAELASLVAEAAPALLAPHLDLFLANLEAREPVLRWEAACTIGHLAAVDGARKSAAAVETLAAMLADESIVLQGHAARALARVARAFPDTAPRILDALVAARGRFPGNRVGYLIEAMEAFAPVATLRSKARRFVEPLAASDIASISTKAKRALKKLS